MKHPMLKGSTLAAAVFLASHATAGGFDNSSRGFDIIYGDNNVVTFSYGQSSVPMKANIDKMQRSENSLAEASVSKVSGSGEILDNFTRPQVGIRYNLNENTSCATQIEKPFAAGVAYEDDALSYTVTNDFGAPIDSNGNPTGDVTQMQFKSAPITTKYDSDSITFACGYDIALSKGEVKIFGGPKLQSVSGEFDEDLTPSADVTGSNDNLFVELDGGYEAGYILGAAYSIPEIALRASILYHSQIDYDATGTISAKVPGLGSFTTDAKAKTFTPQTVEIALQSGIAENTLAFLKLRWSEYGKLASLNVDGNDDGRIDGGLASVGEFDLAAGADGGLANPEVSMFSNDTFDYSFGLGRRVNDQLSLGASFSGSIKLGGKSDDTPLGADATSLRLPGDTAHTVSFGGEYTVIPKLKVNGGLGFTFIDEYRVETTSNSYRAEFDKTEAVSFQMGVTYEI